MSHCILLIIVPLYFINYLQVIQIFKFLSFWLHFYVNITNVHYLSVWLWCWLCWHFMGKRPASINILSFKQLTIWLCSCFCLFPMYILLFVSHIYFTVSLILISNFLRLSVRSFIWISESSTQLLSFYLPLSLPFSLSLSLFLFLSLSLFLILQAKSSEDSPPLTPRMEVAKTNMKKIREVRSLVFAH